MLLIDGVKYDLWTPDNEDALETMVQEHAGDIFGPDCIYFDLKHKLKGNSVAAIPDGYAITFNPDQWWIVEVELSTHPIYEHIQNQVGKFIAALPNPNTRPEVTNALWHEINTDKTVFGNLQNKKGNEVYKWLSDLIIQQPQLAIIIDQKAQGLDDAVAALKIQPKVVEFATYTRENVGVAVHAHRFEAVFSQKEYKKSDTQEVPNGEKRSHAFVPSGKHGIKKLLNAGLLTANQKIFMEYNGKEYEGLILPEGQIKLKDQTTHWSPSRAAAHVTNLSWNKINGWKWWKTKDNRGNEVLLDTIRNLYPGG